MERFPEYRRELVQQRPQESRVYGFPGRIQNGSAQWCTGELKQAARLTASLFTQGRGARANSKGTYSTEFLDKPSGTKGKKINIVHYLGIAADEPERIARHLPKKDKVLPLVQIGWEEDLCGLIATYLDMLSPTYESSSRDGCWFCHNQSVDQLRSLRKNYPDLWAKLMTIDPDSPVTFHSDGRTVHDFDKRFQMEDEGLIDKDMRWLWKYLEEPPNIQTGLFSDAIFK